MPRQLGQSTILVGPKLDQVLAHAKRLARELGGTQLIIASVETDYVKEVRKIYDYTRGVQTSPLSIIIDADSLFKSPEAQNAFLKLFEEPGPNVYLLLCTTNVQRLLPTIRSRAHLVCLNGSEAPNYELADRWLSSGVYERLKLVAKLKNRDEAMDLTRALAQRLPQQTTTRQQASNLTLLSNTLDNLAQNGNVKAQLTNLAVNFVE